MSDYYLVKLKPDCRWLEVSGHWGIHRQNAVRFTCRFTAAHAANVADPAGYDSGDVVIVRVRRVKAKTIPMPKVEIIARDRAGWRVTLNGVEVESWTTQRSLAVVEANALRRALGIPEET